MHLITRDDALWPQVGAVLGSELILKQVDSIDELLAAAPARQPAIVLWDARHQTDPVAGLSRLQSHSTRFAVVALDEAGNDHAWAKAVALRQIVAQLAVTNLAGDLPLALDSAREEVDARVALLGEAETESASSPATPAGPRRFPWIPACAIAAVLIVGGGTFIALRHHDAPVNPGPGAAPQHAPQETGNAAAGADEKADLLVERAQRAMLDRHFIDPADGSALTLYRNALLLDPQNGEAQQGLQRLAEILFSRVQSALDDRKFDVALQALETARSINPKDSRLPALDDLIASLRAEFGPAQILAAINAQNFDRATQLIDEAARSKSLSNAKLVQLREELRRQREESDVAGLVKLIDTRLQQDRLTEPRNDSAVYYLGQARAAGASAAALQPQTQEIGRRLTVMVHAAVDQGRYAEAERLLGDLHTYGVPASAIATLQHDLAAARNAQTAAPGQPQYLDLAQTRLSQGKITEPETDSALFYVNQLRSSDPQNSALPRITGAVQTQILDQARAALDTNQAARADALLRMAATLGGSADLNSLNERLRQQQEAATGPPQVLEASLNRIKRLDPDYPSEALRRNIEGWVDVSFRVTADGKVSNVALLDSSPPGVFDAAATKALSRLRYKPPMLGGKPTAVATKLRIAFRLATQ